MVDASATEAWPEWPRGLLRPPQFAAARLRARKIPRPAPHDPDSGEARQPMKKRPVVVVTRRLPDIVETRMRELFDTRLNLDDTPMQPAALIEAVQSADVLVPTVTDEIDAAVLAQAGPDLRLIANFGNGV